MKFHNLLSENNGVLTVSILFFGFYCIGILYPDDLWGTHYIAFLPPLWKILLLLVSGSMLLFSIKITNRISAPIWEIKPHRFFHNLAIILIGILMGFVFYKFPIVQDNYGNAFALQPFLEERVKEIPADFVENLFSLNLNPESGRTIVRQLVAFISYTVEITVEESFKWLDIVCGSVFIILWLFCVRIYLRENFLWQIIMSLAGLTAPLLLIFFGHIETYAPVFLILLTWFIGLLILLKTNRALLLWMLFLLLLLSIRLHPLMYLLIPAWILAFLHHFFHESSFIQHLFTPKGILLWVYLPVCLAGCILYFFIFEDYKDPRLLQNFNDIDRLFLPLLSPAPPLDRYNLLSANHIFDFFNIMLLWSPPSLFLAVILGLFYRRQISWKKPEVIIIGTTLLLFMTFLFMINPLFSMPMDWDLFSLPAPLLLILVLTLVRQVKYSDLSRKTLLGCVALSLLCLPVFAVNSSVLPHSYRLESVGIRVYKTYYEHSGKYILYALSLIKNDPELYLNRKQNILNKLKKYAIPGNDIKYASLLMDNGIYFLRTSHEFAKARDYFKQAHAYSPELKQNIVYLMEANFQLKDFAAAYKQAVKLIEIVHPDKRTALRYGIHCALEAGLFSQAQEYCKAYLADFPGDKLIQTVNERLETNSNIGELKFLFAPR